MASTSRSQADPKKIEILKSDKSSAMIWEKLAHESYSSDGLWMAAIYQSMRPWLYALETYRVGYRSCNFILPPEAQAPLLSELYSQVTDRKENTLSERL
jgi:hypothetical protein